MTSAVDTATVAQDQAQVTQARITVATAAKAVRATVLRAPISGTVTAVNASVGDTVGSSSSSNPSSSSSSTPSAASSSTSSSASSSSGVVTIANLAKLEVVAGFAEADATKIKVGQNATVHALGAPEHRRSPARSTAVSPTSTVTSNVVTYDVTVAARQPARERAQRHDGGRQRDGRDEVERAAAAQRRDQHDRAQPRPSRVLRNGKQTTVTVTTGLVGSSTTEILTGVKAGDVIVEPTVTVIVVVFVRRQRRLRRRRLPGGGPGVP